MFINIKPLSVNEARQGKRFKTQKYKNFERFVLMMLPKRDIPTDCKLYVKIDFHFSNSLQDIDSSIKLVLDIMQKKRGFNDRNIYRLICNKIIVPKGNEGFELDIDKL